MFTYRYAAVFPAMAQSFEHVVGRTVQASLILLLMSFPPLCKQARPIHLHAQLPTR
jgi:hypothetical protein